jgi:uncharacterized protein YggE
MRFLILNAVVSLIVCSLGATALAQDQPQPRTISVTGDSEILVTPDKVVITLGVEIVDKDITEAKKANDRLIKDLIDVAGKYNIAPDDIQTDYISIRPKYDRRDGDDVFIGHFVGRKITFTLKDIAGFDNLMSDFVAIGDIQVQSVQFQTSELRKHRDNARSMAVKAAFEKAAAMAAELGQKIGKPLTVNEQSSRWYSPYNYWNQYRGPNPFNAQNVAEAPSGAETPMAAGKISVTASVSASFELE